MSSDSRLQQYLLLSKGARGRAVVEIISKATSEPGIFSFGELIDTPSVQEIKSGEFSSSYRLLELFAFGTWPEYRENASQLPEVNAQQQQKLKQLTVLSLAAKNKVIPYSVLMQQLDIPGVRELEDFIISDCFYNNSCIKGKLDHKLNCLQVHNVISRDVRPENLLQLEESLSQWLMGSEALLSALEQRMQYAATEADLQKKHKAEVEKTQEEVKRSIKADMDLHGPDSMLLDDGVMDLMDEDRVERTDRMVGRPKSRRR